MVSLFCVLCGEEFRSQGTIPPRCPRCLQTTRWMTSACLDVPKVRYLLNPMDVKLLRSLRIDPQIKPDSGVVES